MESSLLLFAIRLAVPLAASQAAEDRQPETVVTQELISSIHTTPQLIFNPFPAYAQKYLPFAMAASMESTSMGAPPAPSGGAHSISGSRPSGSGWVGCMII